MLIAFNCCYTRQGLTDIRNVALVVIQCVCVYTQLNTMTHAATFHLQIQLRCGRCGKPTDGTSGILCSEKCNMQITLHTYAYLLLATKLYTHTCVYICMCINGKLCVRMVISVILSKLEVTPWNIKQPLCILVQSSIFQ